MKKNLLISAVMTLGIRSGIAQNKNNNIITVTDSKPVAVFQSSELIKKIDEGYMIFDSAYMKKNIGVDGKVKSIDHAHYNITLEGNESAVIVCTFDSRLFLKNMMKTGVGSQIKIQGIYVGCQGFDSAAAPGGEMDLLDAVMQDNKVVNLRTCALNQ